MLFLNRSPDTHPRGFDTEPYLLKKIASLPMCSMTWKRARFDEIGRLQGVEQVRLEFLGAGREAAAWELQCMLLQSKYSTS